MDAMLAYETIGDNVIATDPYYGTYIGELQSISTGFDGTVFGTVKILACIEYPCQYAIIFTEKAVERKPFRYKDLKKFDIKGMSTHVAKIPNYFDALKVALNKAIFNAQGKELQILEMHFKDYALFLRDSRGNKGGENA